MIVVCGPPAVGKTTVARLLRDREAPIDETGVHVVWHEFDEPDADVAVDTTEHTPEAAVDLILAALEPLLGDGDGDEDEVDDGNGSGGSGRSGTGPGGTTC